MIASHSHPRPKTEQPDRDVALEPAGGRTTTDPTGSEKLLRDEDLAHILNCSVSTVWRRVGDGTISRPLKIGGMSRWPPSEVAVIIERARQERDRAAVERDLPAKRKSSPSGRRSQGRFGMPSVPRGRETLLPDDAVRERTDDLDP